MRNFLILALLSLVFTTGCGSVNSPQYVAANGADPSISDNAVFPHKTGWKELESHGKYVKDNGVLACQNACHGEDLKGGSARACTACHSTYPHNDMWAAKGEHGALAKADIDTCLGCHKDIKTSCNSCHPYVSHKWQEQQHGKYVLTDDDGFSEELYASSCKQCHGDIYPLNDSWPSGATETASGNPTCYSCHKDYPHIGYEQNYGFGMQVFSWYELTPVASQPNTIIRAHSAYIGNNEHIGWSDVSDKMVVESCGGGTDGLCHNNARHFMEKKSIAKNCYALCHAKK